MLHTLKPLRPYGQEIQLKELLTELRPIWKQVSRSPHWARFRELLHSEHVTGSKATSYNLGLDAITGTLPRGIDHNTVKTLCRLLVPWRVGPYQLGETTIDAEWRSNMKWNRISQLIGSARGKRVADVGCSNGYFLFRLAQSDPELAIGFDPVDRCWLQFALLQSILQVPRLAFVPTGIASLDAFPNFFDLVMCMGVIYHQRDPFTATKTLFNATRPGGRLLLESLVINDPGSHLLIPRERYAKMRNAWIIPTPEALASIAERAGFRNIELHHFGPVTTDEQRRTEWAPYESLADFLDPNDPTKTIEGYPAPHSAAVVATKL